MSSSKKEFVSIRFDKEEKKLLEEKAEKKCMTLSQYIRYVLLEGDYTSDIENKNINQSQSSRAIEFLNNNLPLLYRFLIKCMYKTEAIAQKTLDSKTWDRTEDQELKVIKALGITLEEEMKDIPKIVKW